MKTFLLPGVFAACSIAVSSMALADMDALVEARQENFKILGKNTKELRTMFKGGLDWEALAASIQEMQQASDKVVDFFPAESADTFVTTEAKPEIWENFADFTSKAEDMRSQLHTFAETAAARDASASADAFTAVGKACKNCHDNYREK